MGQFLNYNSFLLTMILVWISATAILLRGGVDGRKLLVIGGITIILLAGYFLFRPKVATEEPADQIRAQIGAGEPVLLQFQSEY